MGSGLAVLNIGPSVKGPRRPREKRPCEARKWLFLWERKRNVGKILQSEFLKGMTQISIRLVVWSFLLFLTWVSQQTYSLLGKKINHHNNKSTFTGKRWNTSSMLTEWNMTQNYRNETLTYSMWVTFKRPLFNQAQKAASRHILWKGKTTDWEKLVLAQMWAYCIKGLSWAS